MTFRDFLAIDWPEEFVVEYINGTQERLLRGEGVSYEEQGDDPEGRGSITAELPKQHTRHQSLLRSCYLDEVVRIRDTQGRIIWP